MRKETLKKFKKMLEAQRHTIIYGEKIVREDFSVNMDDRYDEVDQAATDNEQSMRMRLCNRQTLLLKKIESQLVRIEDGTFGECNSCGEEIGIARLTARPTATLCVSCKEEQERREGLTIAGLQHKSIGQGFSRKFA